MARAIYFDCFSGISGDMTLGALLHAGLPFDYLQSELAKLALPQAYELRLRSEQQQGISGIKLDVLVSQVKPEHRSINTIEQLINDSQLNEPVKARATAIFRKLARAEAKIHGVPLEEVHFHEVGAIDAIVDIVGSCIGFDYFQLEEFYCGPLPPGAGFVRSEHGLMPVPAPATLELLSAAGAIFAPALTLPDGTAYPARTEMVTPTGAAILATLCQFERPTFKLQANGYGYGSKVLAWPNALRIWLGEVIGQSREYSQKHEHSPGSKHEHPHDAEAAHSHSEDAEATHQHPHASSFALSSYQEMPPLQKSQPEDSKDLKKTTDTPGEISLLETNLDDMTAEGSGYLMEQLLTAGALDVYFTPIQMKKNRPAILLSAIVRPEDESRFAKLILRESSSFGLRVSHLNRYIAGREFSEVEISAGKVKVKHKLLDGQTIEAVPEYESVAALARQTGRPWREIYDEVKRASHRTIQDSVKRDGRSSFD